MTRDPRLRALPSVEELSTRLAGAPRAVALDAARDTIAAARAAIRERGEPPADLEAAARERVSAALRASLRPVVNATGVIVHTNLGRAPLAPAAAEAVERVARGYSNLEYDLAHGRRGSRHAHVEELLVRLTGAEAALVVNNCAAAVMLCAAALAAGRELIVSRGQLVEIGGSFRIPEVVAQSGAELVEVGTTNRTSLNDYRAAVSDRTGAILRVHPSNFRVLGFVEEVEIEELCGLGVPVVDDAGSGALIDVAQFAGEPALPRSVAAGCALVCCSGDKLLGGPQAGLVVGKAEAVERCREHPLTRALRIDKLSLAALEATLRVYLEPTDAASRLPVLRMLSASAEDLRPRAESMAAVLAGRGVAAEVIEDVAKIGGGALPLLELTGPVCAVNPVTIPAHELAARLRAADPPVVGRIRRGRVLLDPRTLRDEEEALATGAVADALA